MNWDTIGAFSELIGAVAVVISLVYLAIQIRQNTRQVEESTIQGRAAALHSSLSYAVDNRIATFSDENTASIYLRGLKDAESLNELEQLRFRLIFANVVDAGWNMYSQSKMTGFSPEAWKAQARTIIRLLDTNGGKWFWDNYGSEYHQDFRIEIERISAGGS